MKAADVVYRIRRRSDGLWFGRNYGYGNTWTKKGGRLMKRPALMFVLKRSLKDKIDDMDIIIYVLHELQGCPACTYIGTK